VVSGQWSVVSGQWWSVVSGQWSVVSGQWSVVSGGQWSVVSGQWSGKAWIKESPRCNQTHDGFSLAETVDLLDLESSLKRHPH
jgi:hypothetical protein